MTILKNSSKDSINLLFKEIKKFCNNNSFDLDWVGYTDLTEFTISVDSMILVSWETKKNDDLTHLFKMLGVIYYLNSKKFRLGISDLINYREKNIIIEFYNSPKIVGETLKFINNEWVESTKRIKVLIKEPNDNIVDEISYTILCSLINLYIL
jgi:hypothetical protein